MSAWWNDRLFNGRQKRIVPFNDAHALRDRKKEGGEQVDEESRKGIARELCWPQIAPVAYQRKIPTEFNQSDPLLFIIPEPTSGAKVSRELVRLFKHESI